MVRASALSPHQVRSGLAALKDEAASKGWPPLIWTRAYGYQLGAERAALEVYERQVVSEKLTQLRRFITGTVAPLAAAHPNDNWVRHIVAQLNSIESTLDLISSAGPPQQVTNGEEDASLPLPLRHLERRVGPDRPAVANPGMRHASRRLLRSHRSRSRCARAERMGLYGEWCNSRSGSDS